MNENGKENYYLIVIIIISILTIIQINKFYVDSRSLNIVCPECGSYKWKIIYRDSSFTDLDTNYLFEWECVDCGLHYIESIGWYGNMEGFYIPELRGYDYSFQPSWVRDKIIVTYSYKEYINK